MIRVNQGVRVVVCDQCETESLPIAVSLGRPKQPLQTGTGDTLFRLPVRTVWPKTGKPVNHLCGHCLPLFLTSFYLSLNACLDFTGAVPLRPREGE